LLVGVDEVNREHPLLCFVRSRRRRVRWRDAWNDVHAVDDVVAGDLLDLVREDARDLQARQRGQHDQIGDATRRVFAVHAAAEVAGQLRPGRAEQSIQRGRQRQLISPWAPLLLGCARERRGDVLGEAEDLHDEVQLRIAQPDEIPAEHVEEEPVTLFHRCVGAEIERFGERAQRLVEGAEILDRGEQRLDPRLRRVAIGLDALQCGRRELRRCSRIATEIANDRLACVVVGKHVARCFVQLRELAEQALQQRVRAHR
jgi:hypothetical protein